MIPPRLFLTLTLSFVGAMGCTTPPVLPPLRVVTYNIHGGAAIAPVAAAEAALRTQRGGRPITTFLAEELASLAPDVIALQEAHSEEFVRALAVALDMHASFFPGGSRDPSGGRKDGIPAAILTRHPIIESVPCPLGIAKDRPKGLFTRGYGKIVIDAHGESIAVFVAHLLPSWKDTTRIRQGEIAEIAAAARRETEKGRSVLVLGDMNHPPSMPEYRLWAASGFVDAVASSGWGEQFTSPSREPTERIDYVFSAGPITDRLESATVLTGRNWVVEPAHAASFALSDHLPVLAVFRGRRD
jgi:endonuclease/exonuclease/phosphatase family metal-dependent hydrolase